MGARPHNSEFGRTVRSDAFAAAYLWALVPCWRAVKTAVVGAVASAAAWVGAGALLRAVKTAVDVAVASAAALVGAGALLGAVRTAVGFAVASAAAYCGR